MKYPKILIIGQYFNTNSGGGITLTNLFCGWDKNNIAVAACDINNPDFSVCEKFYIIGEQEIKRGFPFNLNPSQTHSRSGIINKNQIREKSANPYKAKESKLKQIKDYLLLLTGQIHRRRKLVISKDLLKWIDEFSPDIIYSQLSSHELIRLVHNLNLQLNIPMVFHLMDDWPITITHSQKSIFRYYWSHTIDKELRQLFSKAFALMSISEYMSEEYKIRYGLNFIPFHNPIDVRHWTLFEKKNKHSDTFTILYAGRIGPGIKHSLSDVACAINNLTNIGLNIEFHIQATNINNLIIEELVKYKFIKIKNPVPYNELPKIFAESDLLLLPNDFDKKSISFLKYSMPTKASEYMASGTPVLVFSSSETALTKHALKYGWGYVVSENSTDKLEAAISKLYKDMDMRIALGYWAKEFALEHYDSEKIREGFKKAVQNNFQNI